VGLELSTLLAALALHGSVGSSAREREHHRLVEQRERLDLADRVLGGLRAVEDDEGLAFGF
jgi:hypothetical protein